MACQLPGPWVARRRELVAGMTRFRPPRGAHLSLYEMAIKRNAEGALDSLEAWCRHGDPRQLRRATAQLAAMRRFVRRQDARHDQFAARTPRPQPVRTRRG
jgi:hypothetical protein